MIRTEAGGTLKQKKDRFKVKKGDTFSYDNLDPEYFRESLNPAKKKPSKPSDTGRRIVYEEGEGGGIVPGVVVEHDVFGEGKVLSLEGRGEQRKAIVFFKEVGQKKLMLRFAKLRRIG